MAGVTDGNGKSSDVEGINEDLAIIKTAYHNIKSDRQLNIVAGELIGNPYNLYIEWIR